MASRKTYVGTRDGNGIASVSIEFDSDGQIRTEPLFHLVRHSPTGLEWGYAGSGPADLAHSILADHLDMRRGVSVRLYQSFKAEIVSKFADDGWRLRDADVNAWLNHRWSHMDDAGIQSDLLGAA